MLKSASVLGISLLCTYGTPVADVLAHLPPSLPLILDYHDLYNYITADDGMGIMFALLVHRDRVRRIRIMQSSPVLEGLTLALRGEFPNLEYLHIERHPHYWPAAELGTTLDILLKSLRAPRLRYLVVMGFCISPLFTTIGHTATLSFEFSYDDYFRPNDVLFLQQFLLETSRNTFNSGDDIYRHSLQRAIKRLVTPYLRWFQGSNAYLGTLLPPVTVRLLERIQHHFFVQLTYQLTYLIPPRQRFVSTVEVRWLKIVTITFFMDHATVYAFSRGRPYHTLSIGLGSRHLDCQVARTVQVIQMLRAEFSVVEHLTLGYDRYSMSPEWNNEAGRKQWRELLSTFDNAKTLRIEYGLTGQLSRSLEPDEGESPMDLLPKLQELSYSAYQPSDDAFSRFIDSRQNAGRLVTVTHRPSPWWWWW